MPERQLQGKPDGRIGSRLCKKTEAKRNGRSARATRPRTGESSPASALQAQIAGVRFSGRGLGLIARRRLDMGLTP